MRNLLHLLFTIAFVSSLSAQREVKITDANALADAPSVRKDKAAQEAMRIAGFSEEETSLILQYGDRDKWPEGIRTDTARAINGPYVQNYVGFRLCDFQEDSTLKSLVMIPAKNNIHMPSGLRPLADLYLVLPDHALENVDAPKPRPTISRGPRWKKNAKVRIMKPDQLYAAYDLAKDTVGQRALYKAGMSRPEIDAVIFRSTERNWPEGIDSFEKRYPLLNKFNKYNAYLGARWDDKVLLIVPVEKNRRMPLLMRPFVDLYFIYTTTGVELPRK